MEGPQEVNHANIECHLQILFTQRGVRQANCYEVISKAANMGSCNYCSPGSIALGQPLN